MEVTITLKPTNLLQHLLDFIILKVSLTEICIHNSEYMKKEIFATVTCSYNLVQNTVLPPTFRTNATGENPRYRKTIYTIFYIVLLPHALNVICENP